jgi:hypothetical protein
MLGREAGACQGLAWGRSAGHDCLRCFETRGQGGGSKMGISDWLARRRRQPLAFLLAIAPVLAGRR